jgi:hypothetical protein
MSRDAHTIGSFFRVVKGRIYDGSQKMTQILILQKNSSLALQNEIKIIH